MTTHNVINSPLANSSGSGNFVGSTSPALSPVTIGAATATTIDFVYPNDEMFGTTNADNANSGIVGEYISSVIPFASAVSIGTASATNLTHIVLSAGDWDVFGNLYYIPTGVIFTSYGWVSSTPATMPDASLYALITQNVSALNIGFDVPKLRFNVSTSTTVYITGYTTISVGSCTFCGGIYARRRR
jgi:hypothetical protein